MLFIKLVLFIGAFVIFYSYIGYGILLWLLVKLKNARQRKKAVLKEFTPPVTLIVAAYNEEEFIDKKIQNTLSLRYPREMFKIIFVTDGSTDATSEIVAKYPDIQLLHSQDRRGKVEAMHRAMGFVQTPYVIFSDANTLLNEQSIRNLVRHYQDMRVGGVAGEKRIITSSKEAVAGAGEGLYWKYESFLKKLDSDFYSVVGAAGELFSIKTELYEYPGRNILLDDFIISLSICRRGYRIAYEPDAFAMESASLSLKEEQKRKIRISAGAFQSMIMMSDLMNVFKYPMLSFQYISHRVLRWTLCPIFLPLVLISSIVLVAFGEGLLYTFVLAAQLLFYLLAFLGFLTASRKTRIGFLYAPYYLLFINYSLYAGFFRFMKGNQTVLWEKASRAKYTGV
jgi:cellulose synthase/poly-beta-1,6-N-acetylglucosamine synthase-like glycosyltransferase